MKKILCFGDSNIFGFNPLNGKRYNKNERWSGILQYLLGDKFCIVEAGCNNRTAFSDNPNGIEQTGYKILPSYLSDNIYSVILAVGINDLQKQYHVTENDIKEGIQKLIDIVKDKASNADIILVAPTKIDDNIFNSFFSTMFDKESISKSSRLPYIYEQIANKNNCKFVNLNDYILPSNIDGLHYDVASHSIIAHELYKLINDCNSKM